MDPCDSDDVVEDEKMKMNMLHRYKLSLLNIANLFQLIELFIVFALFFWSSSRIVTVLNDLNISGDNLLTFSSNLLNNHVVFLVGNVIIALCYVISRRTDDVNKSEKYDEKLISSSHWKTTGDASIGDSVTKTAFGEVKHDHEVCYDNDAVITESETAIIVACYVISRRNDDVNKSEKYDKTTGVDSIGDSVTVMPSRKKRKVKETTFGEGKPNQESRYYNHAVKLTESELEIEAPISDSVTPSPERTEVTETTFEEEKPNPKVSYNNGAVKLTESETTMVASIGDSVTQLTETTYEEEKFNGAVNVTDTETAMELEVVIKKAVKRIERFRRTQSEKLKREISIKPHPKLRRSVTVEKSRFVVSSGEERSPEMVEEMSNEEFRLAVESFILKQQSMLKLERMTESGNNL